jgi:hypothetical protein
MSEIIRSLGFYQPFGSLMLHGKIETRWVRVGRKPPFPIGKYLLYSTLGSCDLKSLESWCTDDNMNDIDAALRNETTRTFYGYALAVGILKDVSPMVKEQEKECFVEYKGVQIKGDEKKGFHPYQQNCLYFLNVQRIKPFNFKGKQGVGILTEEQKKQIIYV